MRSSTCPHMSSHPHGCHYVQHTHNSSSFMGYCHEVNCEHTTRTNHLGYVSKAAAPQWFHCDIPSERTSPNSCIMEKKVPEQEQSWMLEHTKPLCRDSYRGVKNHVHTTFYNKRPWNTRVLGNPFITSFFSPGIQDIVFTEQSESPCLQFEQHHVLKKYLLE